MLEICVSIQCRAADSCVSLQVLKELYKGPFYYREGGSIPALALMKEHLGIWCTSFGFGLSTDNLHSPNERWPTQSPSSAYSLLKAQHPLFDSLPILPGRKSAACTDKQP